jgi:hypothetical protein
MWVVQQAMFRRLVTRFFAPALAPPTRAEPVVRPSARAARAR